MDVDAIVREFDELLFDQATVAREAAVRAIATTAVEQLEDHPLAFTLERDRIHGPAVEAPMGWLRIGVEVSGYHADIIVPAILGSGSRMAAILVVERQLREQLPEPKRQGGV